MNIVPLLAIGLGLAMTLALGWLAFAGPSVAKTGARRLQTVRFRHSENAMDRMEAQMRRVVAARKPKVHRIAGSIYMDRDIRSSQ